MASEVLNSIAFSLRFFVADGDPDVLCIVDRTNWNGKALVFPRAAWAQPSVVTRPELQQTGVYLLLGPREDGEGNRLFIEEDSRHLSGDSRHLEGDSRHLSPELLSLAEPARLKAKLPTAEMQTLVLRLCDTRWLTTRDLADFLSRDPENLQSRILTGLVKKGLLELRYPGVPNRPDQAYRSVVKTTK